MPLIRIAWKSTKVVWNPGSGRISFFSATHRYGSLDLRSHTIDSVTPGFYNWFGDKSISLATLDGIFHFSAVIFTLIVVAKFGAN